MIAMDFTFTGSLVIYVPKSFSALGRRVECFPCGICVLDFPWQGAWPQIILPWIVAPTCWSTSAAWWCLASCRMSTSKGLKLHYSGLWAEPLLLVCSSYICVQWWIHQPQDSATASHAGPFHCAFFHSVICYWITDQWEGEEWRAANWLPWAIIHSLQVYEDCIYL